MLQLVPLLAALNGGAADYLVFFAGALTVLGGAYGVITFRNPVHSALCLVVTLFGIAVLFVSLHAHFLAVVQVIVYAGAIVVLFLFVIMLLGVDREEAIGVEPLKTNRFVVVAPLAALLLLEIALLGGLMPGRDGIVTADVRSGPAAQSISRVDPAKPNVEQLAEVIFTKYLLAFEVTSVLLVIAVVGAVVLARRPGAGPGADDEEPEESLETVA